MNIKIYEFDMLKAFEGINPLIFRKANMHFDCFEDACDIAKETESKNYKLYQNRYDEYLTKYC